MKNIKTYENYISNSTYYNSNLLNLNDIELSSFTKYLDIDDNKITSLKGIEIAINLESIFCRRNLLTSLDGIENLVNLTVLNCNHNEITSLKGVENLINLKKLFCSGNPIDWVDYVDKKGNIWYIELPKSINCLNSDRFKSIKLYWNFFNENQPIAVSRKFNF